MNKNRQTFHSGWRPLQLFILALLSTLSIACYAHEKHHASREESSPLAISLATDSNHTLWRVQVVHDHLMVDQSQDKGQHFHSPVKVNPLPQKIVAKGEGRPHLGFGTNGQIYLSWTEARPGNYAGFIWFSRSTNGGKSFEPPKIVHQDRAEIAHRFDALEVASDGRIIIFWTDAREAMAAKEKKEPYTGLAIYYAVSTDHGASFQAEERLVASSCECCRIVTSHNPKGDIVALWRHVFEGSERDHMLGALSAKGNITLKRASYSHWKLDGCPHQGGAIVAGGQDAAWWGYHYAYFDGQPAKPGLYYSRVDGQAWAFFPAKRVADLSKHPAHPALWSLGENVWLVWEETEGKQRQIVGQNSENGGKDWSAPHVLAQTTGQADYPALLSFAQKPYLAWNTENEGLFIQQLMP